jgi:hypothetical protein
MNNADKPISPTGQNQTGTGLTKREYFAAMAMQGMISGRALSLSKDEAVMFGAQSIQFADALLAELDKSK